jgi:hypothetical protein
MTLNATSTQINIKNSAGVTKFNSSDKLVYIKQLKTSTIVFYGGGSGSVDWKISEFYSAGQMDRYGYKGTQVIQAFTAVDSNSFITMTMKLLTCTGNPGSLLVGPTFLTSGPVIIDYGSTTTASGSGQKVHQEILQWRLDGSSLYFWTERFNNPTMSTIALTYTAVMYGFL